jgi:hypothetical protein
MLVGRPSAFLLSSEPKEESLKLGMKILYLFIIKKPAPKKPA